MRNIFQHIRRQPKSVRDNYALGIAGSFTSIILLLWIVDFPSEGLLDALTEETAKLTPFTTLISESKEKLAEIKASLNIASGTDSLAAVVTAGTTTPEGIVLSDADIALALEKASVAESESGTTTPAKIEYTEVLIGTTTASSMGSFTGTTTTENTSSATIE